MAEDRTPASILVTAGSAPLDLRTIRHPDLTNFLSIHTPVRRAAFSHDIAYRQTGERGKRLRPKDRKSNIKGVFTIDHTDDDVCEQSGID